MRHPMASHSPGPVPDPWDRLPIARQAQSMAHPTALSSHSAKDRQRASGRQSIPATRCLPSTGHSRRLAVLPPKP
ncbi:hypothetical protein GGI43DRAFT_413892 [Trichoderma evansii]